MEPSTAINLIGPCTWRGLHLFLLSFLLKEASWFSLASLQYLIVMGPCSSPSCQSREEVLFISLCHFPFLPVNFLIPAIRVVTRLH